MSAAEMSPKRIVWPGGSFGFTVDGVKKYLVIRARMRYTSSFVSPGILISMGLWTGVDGITLYEMLF